MSSTARDLLRQALTAKLAVDLGRAHRATLAAEHAGRLAAQLVAELADARAREERRQAAGAGDVNEDDDVAELLAERYPAVEDADDDEPAGPT